MGLKLFQVGLGHFGQRWVEVVLSSPDWEFAGLATRNESVLSETGARCGLERGRLFAGLETGLKNLDDIDAVLVTTPYFHHTEDALLALAYGKHVLVEKPLCGDIAEAYKIREAARRSGKTLMVSENYRFSPGAVEARSLVERGKIGVPEFVCVQFFAEHAFAGDDWRNELKYPVLLENSTHHFDLLRYITDREADRVTCAATSSRRKGNWAYPSVSVQIEMEDGLLASFNASWAYPWFRTPWPGSWWIRGTRGGIRWDDAGVLFKSEDQESRLPTAGRQNAGTLHHVLAEFTDALKRGRRPMVDIEDNVRTVEIMVASMESAEREEPVAISALRRSFSQQSVL